MFRCAHISKSFDGVAALKDVNISFPDNGVTAIIGPNGAGKTTLMNVLSGYQRADSGRCMLGDREVTWLQPYQIARFGVARSFQNLRLIQESSVLDNVLLARPRQKGEHLFRALTGMGLKQDEDANRIAAREALKFVGLESKSQDRAAQLSFGQQKLLALACCVASEARVLLLDEPVSGVDMPTAVKALSLLRELAKSGTVVLMIEHDMETVRTVADHVVLMGTGAIAESGTPNDVLNGRLVKEVFLG